MSTSTQQTDTAEAENGGTDQIPIRLPNGEQAWVSPQAFNLIGEKAFHDSQRLRELQVQRNLALAIAGAVLVVFAAGAVSWLTRPSDVEAVHSEAASTPTASANLSGVARSPGSNPPAGPTANDSDIEQVVLAWAQAWSNQDAETVQAFYSPSFLVPDGMARATWARLRRERIENPELLTVTVEDLVTQRTGPESARARFIQIYDTPGYRAWVTKTLVLASESGRWLIVEEQASLAEIGPATSP